MKGAFQNCINLKSTSLPPNNSGYRYTFNGCSSLKHINGIESIKGELFRAMNNTALEGELILPFVTKITANFMNCKELKKVVLQNVLVVDGGAEFQGCDELLYVEYGEKITEIYGYNDFKDTPKLQAIVIRAIAPPILKYVVGNFGNHPIYVPDESVNSYKTATNWSLYSDRIYPISELVIPSIL